MASTPSMLYRYTAHSAVRSSADGAVVGLATDDGVGGHPRYFDGLVHHPRQTARALLLVAGVARSRFYLPPNSTAMVEALDPVVTADGRVLRFESFSACCGVYARLDLTEDSLSDAWCGTGTTNVDVNAPMRQALGRITDRSPLRIEVGLDEVAVSSGATRVVERKVPLPERWVRGFAQTQVDLAGMTLRHEMSGPAARRFLRSLPASRSGREQLWVVPAGDGVRMSARPTPDAVGLAAPYRLRSAADLAEHLIGLRAYGPAATSSDERGPEASAWELVLDDARLWMVISPDVTRGFSGEGGMLTALALDLPGAVEAAAGRTGFDLAEGRWFRRELPLDRSALDADAPRLRDARALVAAGAVVVDEVAGRSSVTTDDAVHTVRFGTQPPTCTCPWYARHRGERGPCKHVLATTIVRSELLTASAPWPVPT